MHCILTVYLKHVLMIFIPLCILSVPQAPITVLSIERSHDKYLWRGERERGSGGEKGKQAKELPTFGISAEISHLLKFSRAFHHT